MCICLVLLKGGTSFDVFSDTRSEARPPEFSCNKLAGFEKAGITSSLVVMMVE